MRIRKRKVPLPISSLSPVPIWSSDPNLPLVQLQVDHQNPQRNLSPDRPSQPSGAGVKVPLEEDGKKREEVGGEMMRNNDSREGGDQKMKTKVKNKCKARNGQAGQEGGEEEEVIGLAMDHGDSRKKGRGGAILEGSRCSRVNGRGWRCCQQTLVGYSLCEHHLGKGRLRSMSNVSRNNNRSSKTNSRPFSSLGSPLLKPLEEDQDAKDQDGKKPENIVRRKTSKIGLVKARSLSSLLGLANEAISMAENEI